MTIPSEIGFAARVRAPEVYERARDHLTRIELRLAGSLVAPSAGTLRLYSPTGIELASVAASVVSSAAQATVSASSLPTTLGYGPGYMEEWTLTVSGTAHIVRRDAWLARRALYCPVTQADLETAHPSLASQSRTGGSLQPQIDMVWSDTIGQLHAAGQWPARILEPSSLSRYVRLRTLAAVFRAQTVGAVGAGSSPVELAQHYDTAADAAWTQIQYLADDDQDGIADSEVRAGPGQPIARGWAPVVRYPRGGRWP